VPAGTVMRTVAPSLSYGTNILKSAVQQQPSWGGFAESTTTTTTTKRKHNKNNRHASTNLKSLSLVTDVQKINISLRMVKN